MDALKKLCLIRVFRMDRIRNGVTSYITEKMGGATYVKPIEPKISEIFNMTEEKAPIIFVLSPGADPYSKL